VVAGCGSREIKKTSRGDAKNGGGKNLLKPHGVKNEKGQDQKGGNVLCGELGAG